MAQNIIQRDTFNTFYGAPFKLVFSQQNSGEFELSDIVGFLPQDKAFNPQDVAGKTLEFIDYDRSEIVSITFPRKPSANPKDYTVSIDSIKQEKKHSFRDVYTGAVIDVFIGVDGDWRVIQFPANEENINNKHVIYTQEEKKQALIGAVQEKPSHKLNINFYARRLFEGPTKDGKHYIRFETGSPSLDGKMTIKSFLCEVLRPDVSVLDKNIAEVKQGNESKEEISQKLQKLLAETAELPAIGNRMDILKRLITRIRKRKADAVLNGGLSTNTKHSLLGTIVQDYGHMAFLGNPGTLKTVFAEILYWALRAEGVITGPLIRVNGREIIQGYVGQSEVEMRKHIQRALNQNGMLFVDEFHALNDSTKGQRDKVVEYGANAARELIAAMENHRDEFVVVLAGYPKEMQDAILSIDVGLKDRLGEVIEFNDYSPEELEEIFYYLMPEEYSFTPEAKQRLTKIVLDGYETRDETFGNGRVMRNLVNKILQNQSGRLGDEGFYDYVVDKDGKFEEGEKEQLQAYRVQITEEDFEGCELNRFAEQEVSNGIGFTATIKSTLLPKKRGAVSSDFKKAGDFFDVPVPANNEAQQEEQGNDTTQALRRVRFMPRPV